MIGYGNATLPRKMGLYVEPRRHICRMCGEQFLSPSGRAYHCENCKRTDAYKAERKIQQQAAINRSEARRRNRA